MRELEAELSTKNAKNGMTYSVDTGRDVQTDLTPWQRQALANTNSFAIKQGFRRHHPNRSLSNFNPTIGGQNPRFGWEKALEEETEREQIPEAYMKSRSNMAVNQLGLVQTAFKNFQKSQARLAMTLPVGV